MGSGKAAKLMIACLTECGEGWKDYIGKNDSEIPI